MRRLALVMGVVLAGCSSDLATFSDQSELRARWEAQNVYPQHYKDDLLAYMRVYLNNPTGVREAGVTPPRLRPVGPADRYVACVRYNARDSDGKYGGVKEGAAVYVSGKLDQFIDRPQQVRDICKDAAYAPFPELGGLTR
ncbi:MAG: hypothetical protein IRY89_02535 [Pseudolabrys sp.]|nr:hypothetical protein [Pseudolabrys sp.]